MKNVFIHVGPGHVFQEVLDLAKHHLRILERKFPNYGYALYESGSSIRLQVSDGSMFETSTLLVAFFSSSSISISNHLLIHAIEEISYADPKFTDDLLSDKLERLGR